MIRRVSTLMVLTGLMIASTGFGRDPFVGKWTGTLTPDDGVGKEIADTFNFKGQKFASELMQKQGFEPAAYDDNPSPIGVAGKFSVTLKNKAGDSAAWAGNVVNNEMTGSVTITKNDGTKTVYNLKAARQN